MDFSILIWLPFHGSVVLISWPSKWYLKKLSHSLDINWKKVTKSEWCLRLVSLFHKTENWNGVHIERVIRWAKLSTTMDLAPHTADKWLTPSTEKSFQLWRLQLQKLELLVKKTQKWRVSIWLTQILKASIQSTRVSETLAIKTTKNLSIQLMSSNLARKWIMRIRLPTTRSWKNILDKWEKRWRSTSFPTILSANKKRTSWRILENWMNLKNRDITWVSMPSITISFTIMAKS